MTEDLSLLQEIDESIRAENLQRIWQRFGNMVVSGCVAIVFITVAWVIWKNHIHEANEKQTRQLLHAAAEIKKGNLSQASTTLNELEGKKTGIAMLAGILRAETLINTGKTNEARAAFEDLAQKSDNKALTDYAGLQAYILGSKANANPGIFASMADEIQAARLLNAGKNKEAHGILSRIAEDAKAPDSERARAMELLDLADENTP